MRVALIVLLSALTIASFVYAIIAHDADQATAYYNSFARAWELLLGALVGALVPYVRWPMWLRTVVAGGRAGRDPVVRRPHRRRQGVPRPVGAGPGRRDHPVHPVSAANRAADPHVAGDGRMPAPNRLLATAPFVSLGAMAYSLYLWHWPLLIFWLAYSGHTHADFLDGAGVLLVSGVLAWLTTRYVEEPLRYRAPAPSRSRRAVAVPLAHRGCAGPTHRAGLGRSTLLGVALTATSFTWREHVTSQRANGKELSGLSSRDYPGARALINHARVPKLPMRPDGARGQGRPAARPPPTAASATSTTSTSSTAPTATSRPPAPSRWPAARTPNTGSPRWTCWAGCTTSRSSPT